MRFVTRLRPPEDSPVPGMIPGAVHVHEPDRDDRPARRLKPSRSPRATKARLRWKSGKGHWA